MSLLVVGLSHRSASMSLLERVSLSRDAADKLIDDVVASAAVDEAMLLSTCNRVEIYASVEKFHAAVAVLSELLARHTGVGFEDLSPHVYVHYEERAAQHLFAVTSSLDSMLVGEHQILGQVRAAFRVAQERGDAGNDLHDAVEHALHAAKRAHAETGIDAAGRTLIEVGLQLGSSTVGVLAGRRALVVGAGSMAAVAAHALAAAEVAEIVVASRTQSTAAALAGRIGGRAVPMAELEHELGQADLVVSCTGADAIVLPADVFERAMAGRPDRPMFVLDVALPRDVDPRAGQIAGVTLLDLEALKPVADSATAADDVREARRIVDEELAAYIAARRASGVAPTVVALRDKAAQVVTAELHRLERRLPFVDDAARDEIAATVRRVVDKLLHAPTVRVQELAGTAGPDSYPEALRRLFDLDPAAPAAIIAPEPVEPVAPVEPVDPRDPPNPGVTR
ncbi:MAG: glutamyl-tRNA reductase [Actinomycetota bacterium]|nr:glutamyl-tRNA reductase [Actinomycetota bacterium]